eukprot:6178483-Pleurochrysis_carterae.AAC.3
MYWPYQSWELPNTLIRTRKSLPETLLRPLSTVLHLPCWYCCFQHLCPRRCLPVASASAQARRCRRCRRRSPTSTPATTRSTRSPASARSRGCRRAAARQSRARYVRNAREIEFGLRSVFTVHRVLRCWARACADDAAVRTLRCSRAPVLVRAPVRECVRWHVHLHLPMRTTVRMRSRMRRRHSLTWPLLSGAPYACTQGERCRRRFADAVDQARVLVLLRYCAAVRLSTCQSAW